MTKKSSGKSGKQTIRRDAKTGQFVTEEYVKKHPGSTTTEKR
jgi:hypothetical protein